MKEGSGELQGLSWDGSWLPASYGRALRGRHSLPRPSPATHGYGVILSIRATLSFATTEPQTSILPPTSCLLTCNRNNNSNSSSKNTNSSTMPVFMTLDGPVQVPRKRVEPVALHLPTPQQHQILRGSRYAVAHPIMTAYRDYLVGNCVPFLALTQR